MGASPAPIGYLGALGGGLLQMEMNRKAAFNAGVDQRRAPVDLAVVPTLNGAQLVGRF